MGKRHYRNLFNTTSVLKLSIMIFLMTYSCSADIRFASSKGSSIYAQDNKSDSLKRITGECSYYGKKFHGRKTANGEVYDMYKLTAAHRTLPFGTLLEVKNLANEKTVLVRINDRGPFKKGRILDLSYRAAEKIGMIKTGTAQISAKIIGTGNENK